MVAGTAKSFLYLVELLCGSAVGLRAATDTARLVRMATAMDIEDPVAHLTEACGVVLCLLWSVVFVAVVGPLVKNSGRCVELK